VAARGPPNSGGCSTVKDLIRYQFLSGGWDDKGSSSMMQSIGPAVAQAYGEAGQVTRAIDQLYQSRRKLF
jgi:hypothetical protein